MKRKLFMLTMSAVNAHSAALQAIGFTKWQVRDLNPIHRLLVSIASALV